jgi:tRNA-(ms[2]io[6]A)-hydroxylase
MLGLLSPTLPTWVEAVERDLDRLLQDHAHCELKAAQSALSLAARFGGEAPELVAPLLSLAKEEAEHVAMVHERLQARGSQMSLPDQDDYVVLLRRAANEDRGAIPPLLDRLLVSALVEARSCERFKLLSEKLSDATLRAFYKELMASEARHYRLFAGVAEERFGESETRARFGVLAAREAGIVRHLPLGPTVHG